MTSLPANWVHAGYGVPNVCARHGEPAVQRARTQFISKSPTWALPLAILGFIIYLIVVMALRKTIVVVNWPFCERCRSLKLQRLLGGLGLLVLGILLLVFLSGVVSGDTSGVGALFVIVGLALGVVGLIMAMRSGRALIAGGVVTNDGQFIELSKADGRFAAQVEAAAIYAEQHARYQQQQQQAQYQQYAGYPQQGQPAPYQPGPYQQAPYGQAPYGQAPYQQAPYGQAPYGQAPYGQGPYQQAGPQYGGQQSPNFPPPL